MLAKPWVYWALVGMSAIALVLVVVNLILGQSIRSVQAEVNQRQQFINQSIRLNQINQELIRLIAQTAIKDNDSKLHDVLTRNGITVNVSAPPPDGAAAAPTAPAATTPNPAKEK